MSEPSADVRQLAEDVIGDLRDEIRDGRETKAVRGRFVTCSYQAMTAVLDCYDQLRAERDEAIKDRDQWDRMLKQMQALATERAAELSEARAQLKAFREIADRAIAEAKES